MDSFEWNKVFGALLGAAFVVLGLNFLSDGLFSPHSPAEAGYAIEGGPVATAAGADAGPAYADIKPMLAAADVAAGENVFKKCAACHEVEKGGKNKVGPALYGVVDRAIAGVAGFGYSSALTAYGEGKVWSWDELNGFLYKPKAHVKGTSMGFAGVKKDDDRANLIAYLNARSDAPAAMPSPEATPAADAGAAAAPAAEGSTATEGATDTPTNTDDGATTATGQSDASVGANATDNAVADQVDEPKEGVTIETPNDGEPEGNDDKDG